METSARDASMFWQAPWNWQKPRANKEEILG